MKLETELKKSKREIVALTEKLSEAEAVQQKLMTVNFELQLKTLDTQYSMAADEQRCGRDNEGEQERPNSIDIGMYLHQTVSDCQGGNCINACYPLDFCGSQI